MRINGKRTQTQVHLLALAFSDITVLVGVIGIEILSWTCEFCLPCNQTGYCNAMYSITFPLFYLLLTVNRSITLYISYVRAWTLKNVSNARQSQEKSHRKVVVELVGFTTVLTATNSFLIGLALISFPNWFGIPQFITVAWLGIFLGVVWIVLELIFAVFVLVKLRVRRITLNMGKCQRSSAVENDCSRLVAIMALVFCCNLVVYLIDFFLLLDEEDELKAFEDRWFYWNVIANNLNSSVSLIVYLLTSRYFRATFCGLWTMNSKKTDRVKMRPRTDMERRTDEWLNSAVKMRVTNV